MASYPLLGELGFELRALLAKTDHPGLMEQVRMMKVVFLVVAMLAVPILSLSSVVVF